MVTTPEGARIGVRFVHNSGAVVLSVLGATTIVLAGKVLLPALTDALPTPNGIFLRGLILGLLTALLSVGLILVYRATRIINFAQGALGAIAATLSMQVMAIWGASYFVAVPVGIAVAVGISLLTEFLFIRRFKKTPRVLLTVATIFIAQLLGYVELVPAFFNQNVPINRFIVWRTPFTDFGFTFGDVVFTGDYVVALVGGTLCFVGLGMFLKRTRYGVAARAAAENEDRTRLLGWSVKRISLVVWGVAGLLSAMSAVLRSPILGPQFELFQGGPDLFLRALAAAVLAGMRSIPLAVVGAVLISIGEKTVFFGLGESGLTDVYLLGLVVVGFLVQRKRFTHMRTEFSTWRVVKDIRPIPRELRGLPETEWARWAGRLVPLGIAMALPFVFSSWLTNLASVVLIYAIVGVSLVVLTGWSGDISLGHWAIAGVGALATQKIAAATSPPDFFLILLLVGLIGAGLLVVLGVPALPARGVLLAVTTLAFAGAAYNWVFHWEILTTEDPIVRPALFGFIDLTGELSFYFVTLGGLVMCLCLAMNLRRSRWGRNLIATRDNEAQAQALGMRLVTSRLAAFAVSGFIASFAGALYAYNAQALHYQRFEPVTSLVMFSMVVIGGMGSLTGPVLGAIFIRGTQLFLPWEFQIITSFVGILLCLLVFPGGLGQIVASLRDRYFRWIAERRALVVPSLFVQKRERRLPRAWRTPPDERTWSQDGVVVSVADPLPPPLEPPPAEAGIPEIDADEVRAATRVT